jgi:hypothetical protein
VLGALAGLAIAGIASAAVIGVNEDAPKFAEDGGASLFGQMQGVGLGQDVVSAIWTAGRQLNDTDVSRINRAVAAGKARGVKIVIDIYPATGPNARALGTDGDAGFIDFTKQVVGSFHGTVKDYIVLNEPNRTIFASPVDPALTAKVLADAYDAIKQIDSGVNVIGLGLSPRGSGDGKSLFPVQFLAQLGTAYKALNRTAPLMDAISFHPYPFPEDKAPDRTSDWPTIGMADLARLKQAISDAFAGTAQKTVEGGLPIHLDEVAYQVATDGKPGYTGAETVKLVDEATQAKHYTQIVQQVACDPTIASLSFFHFVDETDRTRFQSGFLDAALGPRPVAAAVKQALADTAGGTKCPGALVNWIPETGVVGFDPGFSPDGKTALGAGKVWGFRPTAEEDTDFFAGVFAADVTAADAGRSLQARGRLAADAKPLFTTKGSIKAMLKGLAKFELTGKNGTYVYAIRAISKTNPNRTETAVSQPFTVGTGATVAKVFGGPHLTMFRNCPLFGSDGPDTIVCGFLADHISALGGNDTIDAGGGNDVVSGGPGDDTITGGPGSDKLLGDDGNDVFNARDGERDVIYGGPGLDRAIIDAGLDEVHEVEIVTFG